MNEAVLNILLVDDDLGDTRQMSRAIQRSGLAAKCTEAVTLEQALEICSTCAFGCAILDYLLPGLDGLEALATLGELCPDMALIMATGQGDETVATEAMKRGASDYIRKADVTPVSIRRVVENAVEKVGLRRKLAEQQQELARFADVLVHDLRAPSSAIQTFIWGIQDALRDGNLALVAQYCGLAVNAAARMDTLVAVLYQYTHADGVVPFEPVSMCQVLEAALVNLHTVVEASHAVVTSGPLPTVTGSVSQLEQMLQNLIGNGIKYCREAEPRVHISARSQGDDEDHGNGASAMWVVTVRDNGIGIAEKDQQRIFESFTRLHGLGEFEGTGLGLATCRKIVARHGGTIWCESVEGEGTAFSFTLKAA